MTKKQTVRQGLEYQTALCTITPRLLPIFIIHVLGGSLAVGGARSPFRIVPQVLSSPSDASGCIHQLILTPSLNQRLPIYWWQARQVLIRQEINMASDNIDVVATMSAAVDSVVVSLLPGAVSSS